MYKHLFDNNKLLISTIYLAWVSLVKLNINGTKLVPCCLWDGNLWCFANTSTSKQSWGKEWSGGIIFSCDQVALWIVFSVCLPVSLSLCHTFFFCHCVIMKLSGVTTIDEGGVQAEGQGQRSKINVNFAPNSVWSYRLLQNVAQSLKWHRTGAICFSMPSVKFQSHTG